MRIVELIIDEDDLYAGIDAISIVEQPAIEENFVALKDQKKEVKLKAIDEDKRILAGPVLIPNKMIYRKDGEDEYYIHFTKDTVRKASEMFLTQGHQNNSTFEHAIPLKGLSLVESWIIEDKENDKSNMYGMDLPLGTWFGLVKVYNDDVWNDFVKTGMVKGFSIEGYFVDKAQKKEELEQIEAGLELLRIKQMLLEEVDSGEISRAINKLLNNQDYYRRLKENCLEARENNNWQQEEKVLEDIYSNLF